MVPAAGPSAGRRNSKIRQTRAIPGVGPRRTLRCVPRLLVVEDDTAISEPLVRALAREGHDVEHVDTGAAALERLDADRVDLLVLDLGLPDMDGVDVCRRARDARPRLRILILTARSAELDEVAGLDAGADD